MKSLGSISITLNFITNAKVIHVHDFAVERLRQQDANTTCCRVRVACMLRVKTVTFM